MQRKFHFLNELTPDAPGITVEEDEDMTTVTIGIHHVDPERGPGQYNLRLGHKLALNIAVALCALCAKPDPQLIEEVADAPPSDPTEKGH